MWIMVARALEAREKLSEMESIGKGEAKRLRLYV